MKRLLFVAALSVALVLLVGLATASAQVYNSGIQIYNLSSSQANIVVTFYNQDGSVAASPGYVVDADGSITLWPLDVADGFKGSVVIYSDQPVRAIANEHVTGGAGLPINASYESFTEGANQVNLPLIMRNNPTSRPMNTWFHVQNAGSTDANVQVDYYPLPGIGSPDTEFATIKPGASATFDQATNSNLGTRFVGSAVVSSTNGVPIVAAVNSERSGVDDVLMAYKGFVEGYGSDTVCLPLIMSNNGAAKLWTAFQVQNTGTVPTTITVNYGPNIAGAWNPGPDVQTDVGPGESANFMNDNTIWSGGNRYVGGATVTSSNGQPLVAMVNQAGVKNGAFWGASYTGIDPSAATSRIILPLIMSCNPNCTRLWTGFNVQNVHSTISTTITVSFLPSPGYGAKTDEVALDVGPGESANFMQGEGASANWDGSRWIGSAVITASGDAPIVAIVNESWKVATAADGDRLLTYVGFNVEP